MFTPQLPTNRSALLRHALCTWLAGTALLLVPASAFGANTNSVIQPGLYEVTSEIVGTAGQSANRASVQQCLASPDVIEMGLLTEQFGISDCRTTSHSIASGRISLQVQCGSGNNRLTLTGNGTYTDERYVLTNDVAMKLNGTSARVTTRLSAQRIGDC